MSKKINDFLNKKNVRINKITKKRTDYYPVGDYLTEIFIDLKTEEDQEDIYINCIYSTLKEKTLVLVNLYTLNEKNKLISVNHLKMTKKNLEWAKKEVVNFLEVFEVKNANKDLTLKELKENENSNAFDLSIMTTEDRKDINNLDKEKAILKYILSKKYDLKLNNEEDLSFLNEEKILSGLYNLGVNGIISILSSTESKDWKDIIELNIGI
jgi:predicted membrane GTPase involved in stress response